MHDEFWEGRRGDHGDWRRRDDLKAQSRAGRRANWSSDQGVEVGAHAAQHDRQGAPVSADSAKKMCMRAVKCNNSSREHDDVENRAS